MDGWMVQNVFVVMEGDPALVLPPGVSITFHGSVASNNNLIM